MKYRNDFITNSSSMISLWKDFSINIRNIQELKLKYNKKIIVYTGFPNDLKAEEFDLHSILMDDKIPLFDLRAVYSELFVPWVLEKFVLSDLFMEYLNETDRGVKLEVKTSSDNKLYLYAEFDCRKFPGKYCKFDDENAIEIVSFNMDSKATSRWNNLPMTYKYKEFSTLDDKEQNPNDVSIHNYWYSESQVVKSEFLSDNKLSDTAKKATHVHDTEFGDFIIRISRFISDYIKSSDNNLKDFSLWLANKYSVSLLEKSLQMQAEGLCFLNDFMEEFYCEDIPDYDEYDNLEQKHVKIVKDS